MNEADKKTIEQFAAGDRDLRDAAIQAHRRNIQLVGVRGTLHQDFMAEIDNPCPDYGLRARYREILLRSVS